MTLEPAPSDKEDLLPETRGPFRVDHLAELDTARRSLLMMQQELENLQRALRTTQRTSDQAQRELKTSQHDLEAARRDSLSSCERLTRSETEIATLRSAFNCLREKHFQLAAERERLSEDLQIATAKLHRIATDLEKLQRNLFVRFRYLPRSVGRALRHLPRGAGRLVRWAFGNASAGRRHGQVL